MTAPNAPLAAIEHASDDGAAPALTEPPLERLNLEIIEEAGGWSSFGAIDTLIGPVVAALARHPALGSHLPAGACLVLGDDALLRELNARYRKIDKPTNVLSFPAPIVASGIADAVGVRALGDVVLALETVQREAALQTIAPVDHIQHLVVHGLLHLMGYDHETEANANLMESLEVELLAQIGLASPYPIGPMDSPKAQS